MEHFILYPANGNIEAWEGMDGEVKVNSEFQHNVFSQYQKERA